MNPAIFCIAALGLLVVGLGLLVSMGRNATQTAIGSSTDPSDMLFKRVRAHANACEYNPMLAILTLVVASNEPAAWMTWAYILATLSRYLHAAGMLVSSTLAAPQPLRFVGALGTYIFGLALVVAVFLRV